MQPGFPAAVIADARDAAKALMRSGASDEDALIGDFAATALALAEQFTATALIARGFEAMLPVSGMWQALDAQPVTAITGVMGVPAEDAAFVLPVTDYAVDIAAEGTGWVRVLHPGAAGRVRVQFNAGLAPDWSGLPAPVAQGVAVLIAHLFEGQGTREPVPAAVTALWRPFRRMRMARAEYRA
ncbi:hypothetical protein GCM10023219_31880 [Stakelama sediminis]|uniref:Putative phiE125 gp8 family phage protein n=1 Tax=Stakelama sediminis TaxID=463200 RepID=A0A840Z0H5_9SPHN|nr:hypothetical protein [Stakelama sediminis]MBB5719621.1 putative phiE125 gp8 family phage protein [Stakelama sediminis]